MKDQSSESTCITSSYGSSGGMSLERVVESAEVVSIYQWIDMMKIQICSNRQNSQNIAHNCLSMKSHRNTSTASNRDERCHFC